MRVNFTFEVGEKKIEFIIEKHLKNPSLKDSCCLVDLLTNYVQESAPKPPPTNKLDGCLLGRAKVENDDTKAKVYENVLDENLIPINQSFKAHVEKGDESKEHIPCLGFKRSKSKEKEGSERESQ